jgi:hypothetical protein
LERREPSQHSLLDPGKPRYIRYACIRVCVHVCTYAAVMWLIIWEGHLQIKILWMEKFMSRLNSGNACFHLVHNTGQHCKCFRREKVADLKFASLCIIICLKKNQPTRCNNFSSLLLDVYLYVQLNMFRWPAQPRPTALLPPSSNGKIRGCYCSCGAPDDGREDARNMLSCTFK